MPHSKDEYNLQILQAIASGERFTQRSLAGEIGIALGLTNLLIRRLVAKGYVRVAGMGTRHIKYLMTATGREALASATRQSLKNTVHLYTETREQIRMSLLGISKRCEPDASGRKSVVFYGAGDVAEIAYVSLQRTDLGLVGVVDDRRTGRFFDLEISGADDLTPSTVGGVPYAHLVVTSVTHADAIRAKIETLGIPHSRVSSL